MLYDIKLHFGVLDVYFFALFINKIANIAQYKSMALCIVVFLIEAVLTIVFYPIKINVKAHASLDRKSLQLNLSVLKIPIVRLRGNLAKEPYLQINGKKAKIKDNSISVDAVKGAIDYAREQKLLKYFNIIALFALDDAKNSAILCAILAMLPLGISVYGCSGDRFDADCAIEIKINVMQILNIVRLIKEKGKDAKLR